MNTLKRLLLIIVLTFVVAGMAFAETQLPSVSAAQFALGREWRWNYMSLDHASGEWRPYYSERYRVASAEGSRITIEMRSKSVAVDTQGVQDQNLEPHHKFVVDLKQCARLAQGERETLTIEMYTRSFDSRWELLSKTYDGIAFTEKFNCRNRVSETELEIGRLLSTQGDFEIFRRQPKTQSETSWYFLDRVGLEGIAARKLFEPHREYKFEFDRVDDL